MSILATYIPQFVLTMLNEWSAAHFWEGVFANMAADIILITAAVIAGHLRHWHVRLISVWKGKRTTQDIE